MLWENWGSAGRKPSASSWFHSGVLYILVLFWMGSHCRLQTSKERETIPQTYLTRNLLEGRRCWTNHACFRTGWNGMRSLRRQQPNQPGFTFSPTPLLKVCPTASGLFCSFGATRLEGLLYIPLLSFHRDSFLHTRLPVIRWAAAVL